MATRIYANGNKATATANMTADLATYISTNSNGELTLNVQGLANYLRAQFDSISTSAEYVAPATAATTAAAAKAVNIANIVNALESAIGVGAWNTRSDWPTSADVLSGQSLVSAVNALIAECTTLSSRITNYYDTVNDKLREIITRKASELNLDAAVPDGVVRQLTTRAYIQTFVTDRDEESAPSPATELLDVDQNDTVTLTPVAPPAGRHINRWRLYRAAQASETAEYQFVTEQPIATTTFLDEVKDAELQEVCPTMTWDEPPSNLRWLTRMPNSFLAGASGDTIRFSEPLYPYAWPPEYRHPLAAPFVAMAATGSTLVIGTRGKPKILNGTDPGSMSEVQVESHYACVSARSMVGTERGVIYASADGLCAADASGVRLITGPHWSKEDWQALVPSSIFGAYSEGCYIFWHDTGVTQGCYSLNLETSKLVSLTVQASAVFMDTATDTLYITQGTAIKALFAGAGPRNALWRSKKFVMPQYTGFAWLQVESDFDQTGATIRLYGDGTQYHTVVVTGRDPVRVPSGEWGEHVIEIESDERTTAIKIASSIEELMTL